MSEPNSQEQMDKCPIDGNFFVPKNGKKVCSPECKKQWDSEQRRQRKLAMKIEAERAEATAKADREAANARHRRQRAEKKAQEEAAVKAQSETPDQGSFTKTTKGQLIGWAVFAIVIALLILGLPNGR